MRIRRAFPQDADKAKQLFERAFSTLLAPAYEKKVAEAAFSFLTRPNLELLGSGTYYVAEEENSERLLAAGGWTHERPGTKEIMAGMAHLRHFATDPAVARRGIGRAIFRECALNAANSGANMFQVYSSLNAVSFYRRLGLLPVRSIELAFAPDVSLPAVVMEGAISPG